jgi:dTDP-4-dehydrorhamnose 3,5-epimerase
VNVVPTELPGVVVVEPRVFRDDRGRLLETWNRARYLEAGIGATFVQDNVSVSRRGVLRGLHFQHPHDQGKLISVVHGQIFDVAVDVRHGSPTFGRWVGVTLSSDDGRQLWIPEGFAHGFCVTVDSAIVTYKCTARYAPESERAIRWEDADLGIRWPVDRPELSEKDAAAPLLRDLPQEALPAFRG